MQLQNGPLSHTLLNTKYYNSQDARFNIIVIIIINWATEMSRFEKNTCDKYRNSDKILDI